MAEFSQIVRTSLRVVLFRYPHRMSLGALSGVVLNVAAEIFRPYLKDHSSIDISQVGASEWILVGIFLFVVPSAFRRYRLPDDIEQKLISIRRIADEGKLTAVQARILYLELAHQALRDYGGARREAPAAKVPHEAEA